MGSSESKRKMHWVGWEKITKSKAEGGLGIQTAKGRNLAYLSKLNWRFHEEKNALWSQVLRKKYLSRRRLQSSNEKSLPSSCTWKALQKGKVIFNVGTRWSLGRDSDISFWFDNWTSEGPLRYLIHRSLTREEEELRIGDVASEFGWN